MAILEGFLVEEDSGLVFDRGLGHIRNVEESGILDEGNSRVRIAESQRLERLRGLGFSLAVGFHATQGPSCWHPPVGGQMGLRPYNPEEHWGWPAV